MEYHSKYTGAEVDALLDKIAEDNVGDIDSALSTTSENPVQNKVITVALNEKVDKVSGKGLSTNDYTTSEKDKLASLENYDDSEIKSQLTELSERIDNLPKDDEFDAGGNYPLLRVGTADDLAGRGESVPAEFTFRASGGKSIKDGRAYIKRIKGNSVVWNNQSENSLSQNSPTQSLPIGSKLVQGHKYLMFAESITNCTLFLYYNIDGSNVKWRFENTYSFFTSDASISANGLVSGQGALWWYVLVQDSTVEYSANNVRLIDLTQMFGAGNEPTTIEEFYARKPIVEDEYAYNEGQVIHCNTESIKSVGDNAWDEEWELGIFDNNTGAKVYDDTSIRSKNPIKVLPNETYYIYAGGLYVRMHTYDAEMNQINTSLVGETYGPTFTTPTNCAYVNFRTITAYGTTYNHDIMITLVHSGWKQDTDAGYQPYWQDILPLPIIRKYFRDGMKSAGSAHDEIRYNKASGKWEAVQRIGEAKLWELNGWVRGSALVFIAPIPDMMPSLNINNGIMAEYNLCSSKNGVTMMGNAEDKSYITNGGSVGDAGTLAISDTAYNDVDSFVAHLEEVQAKLYYELAKPIVTELDAEYQNFRDYYNVADFGTEQSQSSVPSAAFSADIIYQFNAVDMIREHEIEINELQSIIATMQAQLASLTSNNE